MRKLRHLFNFLFILSVFLSPALLSSCDEKVDPEDAITNAKLHLSDDQKNVNLTNAGGVQTITFTTNYAWEIESGADWCEISKSSGTSENGSFTITVDRNNSNNELKTLVKIFSARNIEKIVVTQEKGENQYAITTNPATNLQPEAATLNGNITRIADDASAVITEQGFVYSKINTNPTIGDDIKVIAPGGDAGDFSANIIGLTAETTYYVRSYAVYFETTFYGDNTVIFTTTPAWSVSVPIQLGNILISDRNAGVNVPKDGIAYNYTNAAGHADSVNTLFKGDYYTWDEAQGACADGWRLPNEADFKAMQAVMQRSEDGKFYIEDGEDRCYFPVSSHKGWPTGATAGYYWSNIGYSTGLAKRMNLFLSGAEFCVINNNKKEMGFSARCVKDL